MVLYFKLSECEVKMLEECKWKFEEEYLDDTGTYVQVFVPYASRDITFLYGSIFDNICRQTILVDVSELTVVFSDKTITKTIAKIKAGIAEVRDVYKLVIRGSFVEAHVK